MFRATELAIVQYPTIDYSLLIADINNIITEQMAIVDSRSTRNVKKPRFLHKPFVYLDYERESPIQSCMGFLSVIGDRLVCGSEVDIPFADQFNKQFNGFYYTNRWFRCINYVFRSIFSIL